MTSPGSNCCKLSFEAPDLNKKEIQDTTAGPAAAKEICVDAVAVVYIDIKRITTKKKEALKTFLGDQHVFCYS